MNDLTKILLRDDILPLGKFETRPVSCVRSGEPQDYPLVCRLGSIENIDELRAEAWAHLNTLPSQLLGDRTEYLSPEVGGIYGVRDILQATGFNKSNYTSYSLRKLGTNVLCPEILPQTRRFFTDLGTENFRMQYGVAKPGWNTKYHVDHGNFRTHGFRAMVPINVSVFLAFKMGETQSFFELEPGGLYFANIASLHRAFNPDAEDRINLIFQMASDALIVADSARALTPLSAERVARFRPEYLHSEVMELWA